jgi:hypothetical protein
MWDRFCFYSPKKACLLKGLKTKKKSHANGVAPVFVLQWPLKTAQRSEAELTRYPTV